MGHEFGPDQERGVFRSTDGGQNWRQVLYKGPDIGAVDLAWAAKGEDPQTIYATLWNARRPPRIQYGPNEGPGSGLYKSTDGGETWNQVLGNGLPEGQWKRAGVAVAARTQGRRVYLLVDAAAVGGLYRSDDAGHTWVRAGTDSRITSRGWYFGRVTVDTKNPERGVPAERGALPFHRRGEDLHGCARRSGRRRLSLPVGGSHRAGAHDTGDGPGSDYQCGRRQHLDHLV